MLLDRAAWDDANLAQLDGVVDFRPGKFLVAKFSGSPAHSCGDWFNQALLGPRLVHWPDAVETLVRRTAHINSHRETASSSGQILAAR